MNHLFAAARKAAHDLVAAAEAPAFGQGPFNPDDLRNALAYRDAVEAEIALVERGFTALDSIADDVKAMRLNESQVLEDEDLDPRMCLDMPVFQFLEESVVVEWPNLIISAEECDRVLAERKAALGSAQ